MLVARTTIRCDQLGRADQEADADPGAHGLRERGGVDHGPLAAVEREHRRQRLAAKAQLDIRVILEDRERVLARQREQALALGTRQRVAGGVVEVGDDVGELRSDTAVECRREPLEVDSVWLDRDRRERGAVLAQREQRAVVARSFDDHLVAGGDQLVEQERVGLHRAVRDEHLRFLDAVAFGDPAPQREVADGRAVGGHAARVVGERSLRRRGQAVDVDDVERRRSASERDGGGRRHVASGLAVRPRSLRPVSGFWRPVRRPLRAPRLWLRRCRACRRRSPRRGPWSCPPAR